MKKIWGIDPIMLGLNVTKLRPIGEYICYCPFVAHKQPHGSFNPKTGLFWCHVCKRSATLSQLIYQLGGIVEYKYHELPEANETQNQWRQLLNNPLAKDNWYLKSRNVEQTTIERLQIRETNDSIIIPLSENKQIVGLIERKYTGKYRYVFYGTIPNVYPDWTYDNNKPVYLVEGVFGFINAFQRGLQAYCIFGTNVTKSKLKNLSNYSLVGAFDNDMAGHIAAYNLLINQPGSKVVIPGIEADEDDWQDLILTSSITKVLENGESYELNLVK